MKCPMCTHLVNYGDDMVLKEFGDCIIDDCAWFIICPKNSDSCCAITAIRRDIIRSDKK